MATVTGASLHYEGSITIDEGLLKRAGILPYEQVHVSNLNNGERFVTYVIPGKRAEVVLNGPTARKGVPGDRLIVFSYGYLEDSDARALKPVIIRLDEKNRVLK
jgi:aspartate 1-decarboxylase